MADLMEIEELKGRLGKDFNSVDETKYQAWLKAVDKAIRNYCHWGIEQQVGDANYYDGTGNTFLPLRTPFIDVTDPTTLSVYLDQTGAYGFSPTAFAAPKLVLGTDYAIRLENGVAKSAVLNRLTNINNSLWFPSDIIYRPAQPGGLSLNKGPYWPAGLGNVKVVCTYGFAIGSIPEDIKEAITRFIQMIRNMSNSGVFVTGESLADYSYSGVLLHPMMGDVRQLLSPYRDVAI